MTELYTREYYVPYLSDSLAKIKADEYKAAFDNFIRDNSNSIDLIENDDGTMSSILDIEPD